MKSKNIIVVSGPSGSGKTTLIQRLMKKHPEIVFSVSHTTRPKRDNETDGVDYHFVTADQFKQMIECDAFVEWAEVYGFYYGTSCQEIETRLTDGSDRVLVLDVDVQGAINIRNKYPGALFILITPPSLDALRERLLLRERKIDRNVEKRLETSRHELNQYHMYEYIVVNDNVEQAFIVLDAIYIASRNTLARLAALMKERFVDIKDYHGKKNGDKQ
ncbi:MAG: guanylate kinase [Candidatus Omnitrophota bacterium]